MKTQEQRDAIWAQTKRTVDNLPLVNDRHRWLELKVRIGPLFGDEFQELETLRREARRL